MNENQGDYSSISRATTQPLSDYNITEGAENLIFT